MLSSKLITEAYPIPLKVVTRRFVHCKVCGCIQLTTSLPYTSGGRDPRKFAIPHRPPAPSAALNALRDKLPIKHHLPTLITLSLLPAERTASARRIFTSCAISISALVTLRRLEHRIHLSAQAPTSPKMPRKCNVYVASLHWTTSALLTMYA